MLGVKEFLRSWFLGLWPVQQKIAKLEFIHSLPNKGVIVELERDHIIKSIHRSQHCQRNWDLSKGIPQEDLDVLVTAVSQCPSKQNVAYYKAHFITNREIIEELHKYTDGFTISYETGESTTNSQVLANLVVAFEGVDVLNAAVVDPRRNFETKLAVEGDAKAKEYLVRDKNMAVGIAAGYLNLSASLMGYSTGCCLCFDNAKIKEILKLDGEPLLLMGIGLKSEELGRRVHHLDHDFIFPTKPKQKIDVVHIP